MKLNCSFNKKIFFIAFMFWIILNITGISNIYISNIFSLKLAILKILHLIFLYFIFLKIYKMFFDKKNKKEKKELKYFYICFSILFILLIIVWPGTWSWDDIVILQNIANLDFTPWQHFFSGLFYAICLETIPFPVGVILIQIFIISLFESAIISKIKSIYEGKNTKILFILMIIIFSLPPVVLYSLSGFRMGLYSFIELYLLVQMFYLYNKKINISLLYLFEISFFTFIVSAWRTECQLLHR